MARFVNDTPADVEKMCSIIGVKDLNVLIEQAIPAAVRREASLAPPAAGIGEQGALDLAKAMLSMNVIAKSFIGMGYHGTLVPGAVWVCRCG